MRLQEIKLSGFKSFVDSTKIVFPSNLIGIVGPNGCGKSNIVDAIRWVLGESSAKQLRGESITDVIFNGSNLRKPIGQASIELIFDNKDGSVGGEYSGYNQIAVRRVVNRDGQSIYSLNGTRCRRRDIVDIFLGTGLGSHNYAIIEQGIVTRLIEAGPESLREYIEEAAGISKYKERRRETENKIKRTNENMNRINDLREELRGQLEHLSKQAKAAERYKKLREEERLTRAKLLLARWQKLDEENSKIQTLITQQETLLESHRAKQQNLEVDIEKQRLTQTENRDNFYAIQNKYQTVNSTISGIEQSIEHQLSRIQQLELDLVQTGKTEQEAQQTLAQDKSVIVELTKNIEVLNLQLKEADQNLGLSDQSLIKTEQLIRDWQVEWDDFNNTATQLSQAVQVQQTRVDYLEQRLLQTDQYLKKMIQEQQTFDISILQKEWDILKEKLAEVALIIQDQEEKSVNIMQALRDQGEENIKLEIELNDLREHLQTIRERYVSLQLLQEEVFNQKQTGLIGWLEKHGLHLKPRLAQGLSVEDGWETAVETVLGAHLEAICIDDLNEMAEKLDSLDNGSITLFDIQDRTKNLKLKHNLLCSKVHSDFPIANLLEGIYVADSLMDALTFRSSLKIYESIITKEGIWIGKNWIRVTRKGDGRFGMISRDKELKKLKPEVKHDEELVSRAEELLRVGKAKLALLEKERDNLQDITSGHQKKYTDILSKEYAIRTQLEHIQQRYHQLEEEMAEHNQHKTQFLRELKEIQHVLKTSSKKMKQNDQQREILLAKRDQYYLLLDENKTRNKEDKEKTHQLLLALQSLETQMKGVFLTIERTEQQITSMKERKQQLSQALLDEKTSIKPFKEELSVALEKQVTIEKQLTVAKQEIGNFDEVMHQLMQKHHQVTKEVQQFYGDLEEKRLQSQEFKTKQTALQEQLAEIRFDIEDLLYRFSEKVTEEESMIAIDKIAARIVKLGAINLAAIQEYEELSKRKSYLDEQNADLKEALETLQDAIYKIDHKTRIQFKETFDKINQHFQELFPQIFRGGKASLDLTGDDLLNAGVILMAKPPGKNIKSISLMSGGEKALTAIALVFSLFQLNPTPFCLLDEVDAPLDDINTIRFCDLLKEIAQKVQLIFISHNKNTIEMAQHLMGVTMNEPGVSKIVAVDMDQALVMAEG